MFKFGEVAVWHWKLGQQRNKWAYNYLYDNHDIFYKFKNGKLVMRCV